MLVMSLPLCGNVSTTMRCAHYRNAVAGSPHKGTLTTAYQTTIKLWVFTRKALSYDQKQELLSPFFLRYAAKTSPYVAERGRVQEVQL